jgi:ATP-dependent exoDNAse (exonuclease V) alpha subunit
MNITYFIAQDKFKRTFKVIKPEDMINYKSYLQNLASQALKLNKKNTKENEKRKKLWKEYFTLKDMYADVKYIFVSTIHKLQGSTYDVAYIDVASLIYLMNSPLTIDLAYRLLYVAVTRARKDIKILI